MKRLAIAFAIIASPALAQQQQPTLEDVQAQYLIETGQLRTLLGQANQNIIQLRKELEAAKAPKPADTEKK